MVSDSISLVKIHFLQCNRDTDCDDGYISQCTQDLHVRI